MYGEEASKLAREAKRTVDHFPPYNDPLVRSITREIRHLHEACQSLIVDYNLQRRQVEADVERRWQQQQHGGSVSQSSQSSALAASSSTTRVEATDPNHTTLDMLEEYPSSNRSAAAHSTTSTHTSRMGLQAQIQEALRPMTEVFWTKYLVHMTPLQRNKRILMAYHYQRIEKIKELAWAFNTLPESSRRLLSPDEIVFFNEYEKQCRNMYSSQGAIGDIDLGLGMISPPKEVFITVRVIKDCGDIVTESGATLSLKKNSEHFVKRGDVERLITQGYLLHVA
ncbi:DNA replication protein psf1 [Dissophora globulifera]|uniref:DNA replication complex GINS protein PSF1 n=1 Tax=Dissophora globulifera TaxID=979702 RepID=A0A9P6RN11_9FUNG|nr:DNA replication protein psf1 [Dissophora globulifera]